ncbi:hypothetical protein BDZ94DRAFT_187800 [Collybia nuda]|uniref:Arrestin-like N-terminal domain-containing protein n=1 Tax=Collybia nuda TaxID=64659 RepID=A0A9P6CLU0_9AGAR|nr:hypothetical protein BDZ94DRAFT_187800 [Collybia nuda]
MALPPAYSSDSLDALYSEPDTSELPSYTRRPTPPSSTRSSSHVYKEFTTELSRKGQPWAVLTVLADGALSASLPTILEGSSVTGSVKLNLDKKDGIHSVIVYVKGSIITGSHSGEQFTFLECSKTLWSQSTAINESTSLNNNNNNNGRSQLRGDRLWPYAISLPKEIVLPIASKSSPETFRLPQTFLERHARASIQYSVNLLISRGKLRLDHRATIVFGYIPITKPSPPSFLRQLAYQENSPLWGPDSDPDGWHTMEPVRVEGKIFNARMVNVKCTLSLALPLCYTRGSAIPCFMTIETIDWQALDLLSSPRAIVMRLRRRIRASAETGKTVDSYGWKDAVDDSQLAAWWPSTEGAPDGSKPRREINGELHLPIDTKPTSAMAHFRIEYSVVLFPFDTAGFDSEGTEPLCTVPIEVATSYAVGPRPRTYTPLGYKSYHALVPSQQYFSFSAPSDWM